MTSPESTYCDSSVRSTRPQRAGANTQSPVLNSGGKLIFTSGYGCSGFVYCTNNIGGVHCCQYGPSPRVKAIVPFQPSNLFARSALTTSSPLSLLAALTASAISITCVYPLNAL